MVREYVFSGTNLLLLILIANNFTRNCGTVITSNDSLAGYISNTVEPYSTGSTMGSLCKTNLIVQLIKTMKWKTVITIFDHTTASQADMFTDMFSTNGVYLIKYDYDSRSSKSEILVVLTDLYDTMKDSEMNILLMCSLECTEALLDEANNFDSVTKQYKTDMNQQSRWLVIPPKFSNLSVIHWESFQLDNVAVIVSEKILQHDNMSMNYEPVTHTIQTLTWTNIDREFVSISDLDNKDFKTIMMFPNIHYGFNGRKFVVGTLPWYPFVMKTEIDNKTQYHGYCIDVLDDMANDLNFTYELVEPADQEWGIVDSNGSWSGLVGMIQKGEVDLLAAPLIIEVTREEVMDFTFPIYFDSWTFLMKRPEIDKKWQVLSPLNWKVLVCVGASLPLCAAILYILERHNPFFKWTDTDPYTYNQLLLYVYGAILAKGNNNKGLSDSGRVFISAWWVFAIVILATYSGNLIAMLSVTLEEAPFNTFEGLVDQDEYKWGTLGGTIYITIMETSDNPVFQKMSDGIKREVAEDPDILNLNQDRHVSKVLNERYVYLGEKSYFEILTRNDCRLVKAKEDYPVLNYGLGLPNNSPYTQLFSRTLLKMTENGFPEIWKEQNWPKHSFCKELQRTEAKVMTIIDLQAAFYIAASGLVLCSMVLVVEKIISILRLCAKTSGTRTKNATHQ